MMKSFFCLIEAKRGQLFGEVSLSANKETKPFLKGDIKLNCFKEKVKGINGSRKGGNFLVTFH